MSIKEVLIDFCDSNGLVYTFDYSGRGMFGRTCFGITCDATIDTAIQLCDFLRDNYKNCDSAYDVLGSARTDSMGLSNILYFPYCRME